MYRLGTRSKQRLKGVHPALVSLVERAIQVTTVDFTVLEGLRSKARQIELYEKGATRTLNSRHLTGHAVDLGALENGAISWHWPFYHQIAAAMRVASFELAVPLEWGGDWKTFPDGPHFQLPWARYP